MKFEDLNINDVFIMKFKHFSKTSIITLSQKIEENRYRDLMNLEQIGSPDIIEIQEYQPCDYFFDNGDTILSTLDKDIDFFINLSDTQIREYFLNNFPEYII